MVAGSTMKEFEFVVAMIEIRIGALGKRQHQLRCRRRLAGGEQGKQEPKCAKDMLDVALAGWAAGDRTAVQRVASAQRLVQQQ